MEKSLKKSSQTETSNQARKKKNRGEGGFGPGPGGGKGNNLNRSTSKGKLFGLLNGREKGFQTSAAGPKSRKEPFTSFAQTKPSC